MTLARIPHYGNRGITVGNSVGDTEDTAIQEPTLPKRGTPFRSYDFANDFYNRQKARDRKAKNGANKEATWTDTSRETKKKSMIDLLAYRGVGTNCRRMIQYEVPYLQEMVSVGLCRSADGARSMAYRST